MDTIRSVVLELVRPGPAHNQLLSPLTPYVALCGGDSPVTVQIPFEHRQLLLRLARLRYELLNGEETSAQKDQRLGELRDMGEILGKVLGDIPALLAELNRVRCNGGKLMHLRLSLSAFELGLLPFETTIAPAGFPGNGAPLFLQTHTPICVTREIRRGQPLPMNWGRTPKVLFAFAAPGGMFVPYNEHLSALHEALKPWINQKSDEGQQLAEIRKHLTVLPNASLQDIRDLCCKESFTHVHILAHGIPTRQAGDERSGLALCNDEKREQLEVVSGMDLGFALLGKANGQGTVEAPNLVSLATCDSGNQGSVVVPGGSLAHELHAAGVPLVVASQFPLWMKASSLLVRHLYACLLEGEDPRWVLYGLRQMLHTDCPDKHDWASVVAYAAFPADFSEQVESFRNGQLRRRVNSLLNRLDGKACQVGGIPGSADLSEELGKIERELGGIVAELDGLLAPWCDEARRNDGCLRNRELAVRLGLRAACDKRAAVAWHVLTNKEDDESRRSRMLALYRSCRDRYALAIEYDPDSTWLITQYLCLEAILHLLEGDAHRPRRPLGMGRRSWWELCNSLADVELARCQGKDKAYALATLAELALLAAKYDPAAGSQGQAVQTYLSQLADMRESAGYASVATRGQLLRYARLWREPAWDGLVEEGLKLFD